MKMKKLKHINMTSSIILHSTVIKIDMEAELLLLKLCNFYTFDS